MTGNRSIISNFRHFNGGYVAFGNKECFVLSPGLSKPPPEKILLTTKRKDNLYVLDMNEVTPSAAAYGSLWSYNVMSMGNKSYCLVITDDYTRCSWVYLLRTKDETAEILKSYILRVENQSNQNVKIIRCDQGTEFKNHILNCFCESKGIERQYSAPRTPQQNGVAERRNGTLIESTRSMLADSKLPLTFWAEAVSTACYVHNRVLIVKPLNKTPYELWFKRVPYIRFLKPFGCPCTILITHGVLPKFGAKYDEGYFVGYSSQSKAYRVFNSRTRIVEESANVECRVHIACEQGKGLDWLFDIDSFT
ncbi:hypothetical protein L1987_38403 [Smallanthus sonchifolius]|uniref:Uncharacterized protein n=1 Tax=Smallanthus sonchifolius TaxID=185202 RepID=A0ACB9HKF5_9ASTR|nr:hypothetical protein L1987_38403 [Smallanthus sonchifolius]